jgi:molybdate transport system substrate-binding protein
MPSIQPLKILSGGAMRGLMEQVVPLFERANGAKVAVEFRLTSVLTKDIEGGAQFDVAVLPRPELDALVGAGKIAAGSATDITRSAIGLAVRVGAAKPDIGSVAAFKRTLLAAKSIAYSDGPSGLYIASLLQRFGLAEAIKPKTRLTTGPVAELVAKGEAEIGLQQIVAILPIKGAELAGPLPGELQNIIGLRRWARGRGGRECHGARLHRLHGYARGRTHRPVIGHGTGVICDRPVAQMCLRHRTFMPISA